MPYAPSTTAASGAVARPIVVTLFIASCLLSVVSWYTTQQGMALYLSSWFALLASLGVQTALVMVAWLVGIAKTRRALLISVYVVTGLVSVAFSYVSLYTWFSTRERPAQIERRLYETILTSAGQAEQLLSAAIAEGQLHVTALDEMTTAEKAHGYISRAQDSDPYLASIREAVAREAQTYSNSYKEGAGQGLRYTAFDRHAKLARQSLEQMQASQRALAAFRSQLKPLDSSEQQIRQYRTVYDAVPWPVVEQSLHAPTFARPAVPAYTDHVDRTATGQEDLLVAFQELFTAPTGRHVFALLLAAFIDIIVFLLAFASGPYFFGSPEHRWSAAAATLDDAEQPLFVRDFLRKFQPGPAGLARVDIAQLSAGEKQFLMLLHAKGSAALSEEEGTRYYALDDAVHEQLVESLASRPLPVRAAAKAATA